MIPWMIANPDKADPEMALESVSQALFPFVFLAALIDLAIFYLWGAFVSGVDKRRSIDEVWISAYQDDELQLSGSVNRRGLQASWLPWRRRE